MLIVTPVFGSMPEPRPQQLITGDRAIQVLDTASSAALQKAGVKVATVTLTTYNELVATLIPETFQGLDANGQLLPSYMPPYASQAAIAALDLLGVDGHIQTQYLPTYLTNTGLASLLGSANSTVLETDPDGTPVVIGGPVSSQNISVAGTATLGTSNMGTATADMLTATVSQLTSVESTQLTLDNQAVTVGTPSGNSIKVYAQSTGRPAFVDPTGAVYLIGNKRIVTSLPATANSQLGDEVIISATGEHRIFKGAYGWRLASPLEVTSVTDRNALTNLYPGMKVYVIASGQDHVYGSDSVWHGTKDVHTPTSNITVFTNGSINDTNWRNWCVTDIADPGFPYYIKARIDMEVANLGANMRVWVTSWIGDYLTGDNGRLYDTWYQDNVRYNRVNISTYLWEPQTGSKRAFVDYRFDKNYANGYSGTYYGLADYWLSPA